MKEIKGVLLAVPAVETPAPPTQGPFESDVLETGQGRSTEAFANTAGDVARAVNDDAYTGFSGPAPARPASPRRER